MIKVVKMDDYAPENEAGKKILAEIGEQCQEEMFGQIKSVGAILIEMQNRHIQDSKTIASYGETMPDIDITLTRAGDIPYFAGKATAFFMGKPYGVSWISTIHRFWKLEHNFESAIFELSCKLIDVAQEEYRLCACSKEE